jgi:hypothetical protein
MYGVDLATSHRTRLVARVVGPGRLRVGPFSCVGPRGVIAVDTVLPVKRWMLILAARDLAERVGVLTDRDGGMIGFQSNNGIGEVTVAQAGMAIAGSNGMPVFNTPKHITRSLRIAATTICLGLSRPASLRRATRAAMAGLKRIADSAGI